MCLTQRLGARLILLDPLTLEVLELVHRIGEARQQAMVFAAAVGEVRCQRSLSRQPPAIEPVRAATPTAAHQQLPPHVLRQVAQGDTGRLLGLHGGAASGHVAQA
jgi:hypothetical protein